MISPNYSNDPSFSDPDFIEDEIAVFLNENLPITQENLSESTTASSRASTQGNQGKKFLCEYEHCDKTFLQNSQLQKHLRTHTGERPYICDKCKKAFTQRSNLMRHLIIHTGLKPFKCTHKDCQKCFTSTSNLKQHLQVHASVKPKFECKICSKSYHYKTSVDKHMKRDHKETFMNEESPQLIPLKIQNIELEMTFGNSSKKIKIEIPGDIYQIANVQDLYQMKNGIGYKPEIPVEEIISDSDFMKNMKEFVLKTSNSMSNALEAFDAIFEKLCNEISAFKAQSDQKSPPRPENLEYQQFSSILSDDDLVLPSKMDNSVKVVDYLSDFTNRLDFEPYWIESNSDFDPFLQRF